MLDSLLSTEKAMHPVQINDHSLVLDLQKDSHEAFKEIFHRYQNKLLHFSVAIVKSEGIARDIVQETFIRLWMNRKGLDETLSLSGYLHTISRNLALNHLKSASRNKEFIDELWGYLQKARDRLPVEEELYLKESARIIEEAIDQLPPRRREIFRLSREAGYTHEVIARELGISKNTVKNQMVTAIREIREHLNRYSDFELCWLMIVLIEYM